MGKILADYQSPEFVSRWKSLNPIDRKNGAVFYSKEIVENIIPLVKTNRPWVTINQPFLCADHAIVFMHGNMQPQAYDWYMGYRDIVMVTAFPHMAEWLKKRHHKQVVVVPLSINLKEIEQYKTKKTKEVAFAGRPAKRKIGKLPPDVDLLEGLEREELLRRVAQYHKVYAVGRCALEAKALGAEILPYDPRYPDPSIWRVVDNCEAAEILQRELDKLDGKGDKRSA